MNAALPADLAAAATDELFERPGETLDDGFGRLKSAAALDLLNGLAEFLQQLVVVTARQ